MEYIKGTEISPLISKGVCKVCYVGQQPNRNHTVITKEVATEMGRKLPGSPIVGYFNKDTNDFDGHNREIVVSNGKYEIVDITRPYGFVPTDANVWFQKFNDEGVEREYLVTDVYIWSKIYPESERILTKGNNHSMELSKENQSGFWTNDDKTNARIFIYNEALIEKLCVLGQNVEPCFEGAQFNSKFSLEDAQDFNELKTLVFSMMDQLQETLNKGGSQEPMEENKSTISQEQTEFEKQPTTQEEEKKENSTPSTTPSKKDEEKEDYKCGGSGGGSQEKKEYNLEEITEYTELLQKYSDLESRYSALEQDKATLDSEVAALREFKLSAERQSKQQMIDSFYMLSDEDKKDVVEHIDTYSLDDIEAKLSILCVRNKVNFNLNDDTTEKDSNPKGLFNLNSAAEMDDAPDWIKAIRETAKSSI